MVRPVDIFMREILDQTFCIKIVSSHIPETSAQRGKAWSDQDKADRNVESEICSSHVDRV
jgi:hypothetical protein